MKTDLKVTRRHEARRERRAIFMPVRMPKPTPRDMIAYAAALEILG
jgi:hypothetical protein